LFFLIQGETNEPWNLIVFADNLSTAITRTVFWYHNTIYFRSIVDILILVANCPDHYIRLGLVTAAGTCVSQIINIASMAAFSNVLCGMIMSIPLRFE